MATRKIGLKYKLTTPGMSTEYTGSHSEGLNMLFVSLPNREARERMLFLLAETHAKCCDREAAKPASGAPASEG